MVFKFAFVNLIIVHFSYFFYTYSIRAISFYLTALVDIKDLSFHTTLISASLDTLLPCFFLCFLFGLFLCFLDNKKVP